MKRKKNRHFQLLVRVDEIVTYDICCESLARAESLVASELDRYTPGRMSPVDTVGNESIARIDEHNDWDVEEIIEMLEPEARV